MESILLAVDGSEGAARAAAVAGRLSRGLGAEVDVLHVVERRQLVPPTLVAEYEEYARIEHVHLDTEDMLRAMGGRVVDRAASLVRDEGGTVRKQEVVVGHPAREIVAEADTTGADVIVMGRRGLGGGRGLLLGSVSTKVGHLTSTTLVTTA